MNNPHLPSPTRGEESTERFVQALALRLDPTWRRNSEAAREESAAQWLTAANQWSEGVTYAYSTIGLRAGVDILIWRLAPSLKALEEGAASLLRSGAGQWMEVAHSFIGVIQPSQYVRRPTEQEQSLFSGQRSTYLVVYPFTKTTDWYLLSRETRQGIMNEHIRLGHSYPQIRQLLANSFGLDDQDFLVAYETDDLPAFSELVRELRGSESRRSTAKDTPILVGIHRPLEQIMEMLGAPSFSFV